MRQKIRSFRKGNPLSNNEGIGRRQHIVSIRDEAALIKISVRTGERDYDEKDIRITSRDRNRCV